MENLVERILSPTSFSASRSPFRKSTFLEYSVIISAVGLLGKKIVIDICVIKLEIIKTLIHQSAKRWYLRLFLRATSISSRAPTYCRTKNRADAWGSHRFGWLNRHNMKLCVRALVFAVCKLSRWSQLGHEMQNNTKALQQLCTFV